MYASGSTGRRTRWTPKPANKSGRFDPHADLRVNREACCDEVNRGVAVWKGKVYVASFDGILYRARRDGGKILWQADTITDKKRGYSVTRRAGSRRPRCGDRKFRRGIRRARLRQRLRFGDRRSLRGASFTVPGDPSKPQETPELEVAVKTWDTKSRWDMGGGGTVWDSMVYDPELNLLYFGTGNGTFSTSRAQSLRRRQSLHLVDPCHQSRYRASRLALPGRARRPVGFRRAAARLSSPT